jgi:hypothetical protein
MRRSGFPNLRLLGLLTIQTLVTAAAPPPSTEPTPLEEQKQRANELAARIQLLPASGQLDLVESLQLRQEGSDLLVGTNIIATSRPRSFAVRDHGLCSAILRMNRYSRPMLIQIDRLDTSDPQATYIYTSLYAIPGKVMLVVERATPASASYVQLIDDRSDAQVSPASHGECRLYVQINDAEDNPISNLHFTARDFKTLVAQNRAVIDLYLRQGLRELGQERILFPDLSGARQALTDNNPTSNPKLDHLVEQYVARLDSANWADRSAAMKSLRQLGEPALECLQSMKRRGWSVEQCNRVDELLNSAWPLEKAAAERIGADLAFVIDCLDLDDPALRDLARKRLEKLTGQATPPQLLSADAAVRRQAVDALREKWLTAQVSSVKAKAEPTDLSPPYPNQ